MAAGFDLFSPFKYFNVAPSTDWQRFINPQFNVTINQSDAAIENSVLARAGSYGKQLGRMQEVLDVLIARVAADTLTPAEARAFDRYQQIRSEVTAALEAAKPSSGQAPTTDDVDALLDRLAILRDSDPGRFDRVAAQIARFLDRPTVTGAVPSASRKRLRR